MLLIVEWYVQIFVLQLALPLLMRPLVLNFLLEGQQMISNVLLLLWEDIELLDGYLTVALFIIFMFVIASLLPLAQYNSRIQFVVVFVFMLLKSFFDLLALHHAALSFDFSFFFFS